MIDLDLLSQDEPLNESEKQEVIENARERLLFWKKRFLASGAVFLLSCASVYPFLFGHSLHVYWESFGKYLVMLSMGLVLPFLYFGLTTRAAWIWLRDLEKDRDPSLRYG
jgi:membrane protease YdiL (CAAX protease family)